MTSMDHVLKLSAEYVFLLKASSISSYRRWGHLNELAHLYTVTDQHQLFNISPTCLISLIKSPTGHVSWLLDTRRQLLYLFFCSVCWSLSPGGQASHFHLAPPEYIWSASLFGLQYIYKLKSKQYPKAPDTLCGYLNYTDRVEVMTCSFFKCLLTMTQLDLWAKL